MNQIYCRHLLFEQLDESLHGLTHEVCLQPYLISVNRFGTFPSVTRNLVLAFPSLSVFGAMLAVEGYFDSNSRCSSQ